MTGQDRCVSETEANSSWTGWSSHLLVPQCEIHVAVPAGGVPRTTSNDFPKNRRICLHGEIATIQSTFRSAAECPFFSRFRTKGIRAAGHRERSVPPAGFEHQSTRVKLRHDRRRKGPRGLDLVAPPTVAVGPIARFAVQLMQYESGPAGSLEPTGPKLLATTYSRGTYRPTTIGG